MRPILILMISAFTTIAFAADEGFSSLEEQMTGREYSAAGLHKLSAEDVYKELEAAGFSVIETNDTLLPYQYCIRARR